MTSITAHLLSLHSSVSKDAFVASVKALPAAQRPQWLGQIHHWIHEPHLSSKALLGTGSHLIGWDYVFVGPKDIPSAIESQIALKWSISGQSPDGTPSIRATTNEALAKSQPTLPTGWTAENHDSLAASSPPAGIALSLDATSRRLGAEASSKEVTIKDFTINWASYHTGPVTMFNLLSFHPGQRSIYFEGYGDGFVNVLQPLYGGSPLLFAGGVKDWSSQSDDGDQGAWEDFSLIWYPSLWHFSAMINSPEYADLDRKFKPAVFDNPLCCCTEIDLEA
ncbi:hypothetical protein GGR57DRAFT_223164 [Xylariaceae sp. FL1272]|nr:hypothetical protein GGR57DRAFT_223164 [Xylariaceae sp. FL1272]